MASASGRSITGQFTLYQQAPSRHVVDGSILRRSRPGTPIPTNATRPPASPYPTQGRRAPRFRPATQQQQYQPLRQGLNLKPPGRPEAERRRINAPQNVSVPANQNEISRYMRSSTAPPQRERSVRPRHARTTETEVKTPGNAGIFPARRPHRTPHASPEPRSDARYRDVDTRVDPKHRSNSRVFDPINEPHHLQSRTRCPVGEFQDTLPLSNLRYISGPPSPRPNSTQMSHSSPQARNKWSFSSESSTSSVTSWSPSSPTLRPSTPSSTGLYTPWFCPCAQQLEYTQRENELWRRRCLDMERALGWITEHDSVSNLDDDTFPVYHDENDQGSSALTVEDRNTGQTTVYANHEVIALDSRVTSPRRRTHSSDGMLVVQRPSEGKPNEKSTPRTADETDWRDTGEQRQRKRARVFPMWAESAPRHMRDKQRDGIRFRFGRDPEIPSPQATARAHHTSGREQPAAISNRFSRRGGSQYHLGESGVPSSRWSSHMDEAEPGRVTRD
ncbi:hypothetical protein AX15_006033 [Amanita polypyramis BW_CC]|nr:hypothetical protein AX15_006033 [Amanita polypyramis BW_CC]